VVAARAREQDGEADRGEHEQDGRVGGQLGEEVSRTARTEGSLGALAAECTGEVGGLALLKEDDTDDEERDDNVQDDEKNDHRGTCDLLDPEGARGKLWISAKTGTWNPMSCGV
jgi:hypothetical protein